MDVNKVWVSGVAITRPVTTKLKSSTLHTVFSLETQERFVDKNQQVVYRPSVFTVESFGRAAETVADRVKQGQRYMVDGYLRNEHNYQANDVRVRVFTVYKEESTETFYREEGIRHAIDVLTRSRDIKGAIQTLEELLAAK